MIILGIGHSHEAHACILRDGVLVAAIAEERLSRLKSDSSYPFRSIDRVLEIAGLEPSDINLVAVSSLTGRLHKTTYKPHALLSVKDWVAQQYSYWKPMLLEGKAISHFQEFDDYKYIYDGIEKDPFYPIVEKLRSLPEEEWEEAGKEMRAEIIMNHLGVSRDQVQFYRHEDCHKAYGYYSANTAKEKALVFTLEGGGDDSSATVSSIENGKITEHWRSNAAMLGRLYYFVTLILGMKPGQHEYKVMGLAPYGTEYHGKRSLEFFRTVNEIVDGEIRNTGKVKDMYFTVKDALEGERFDGIAWGLQTYLEECMTAWIRQNIEKYGISDVVLSGGVAQNIKACRSIIDMPEVKSFWAGPISGDGSLGVGAAWLAARDHDHENPIDGLKTVYLGTSYGKDAVREAMGRERVEDEFNIIENPTPADIACWLDNDLIIARYSGHMEFGQRALGNRSILADPREPESVTRINSKIKYRDFWMPFTPSMLEEEADRILENPKQIYSPFMTMAFDLKPEFAKLIPAASHPADKTVRAQMLRREDNPAYYDLIKAFKNRTGLGVVLNTSFNLHGESIVDTPEDAINTFRRSDLDVLLFDEVAISRTDLPKG